MIKFIRENSKLITKFMMTHLVMSILGIMVGLAVLTLEDGDGGFSVIAIIAGMFTVGFLCFMHYDDAFFAGVKDGIKHRAEGTKPDIMKGLKISLIGYLPVIIIGLIVILVIVATPEGEDQTVVPVLLFYACQGSFLSLYKIIDYIGISGFVVVTLLPSLIACFLGYAIGSKDKTLRGLIGLNVKPPFDGPLERKPKNKE